MTILSSFDSVVTIPVQPSQLRAERARNGADQVRRELLGPLRQEMLDWPNVTRAGLALFADAEGIRLYGRSPSQWFAEGIRVTGRTCVEATLDGSSRRIAAATRDCVRQSARSDNVGVIDLFAGSGNLMLHISEALEARYAGMELDPRVIELTRANLAVLGLPPAQVRHGNWTRYFDQPLDGIDTAVFVVSPPWGDAFSFADGLHLDRTTPPVPDVLDHISEHDTTRQRFAVVQVPVHEPTAGLETLTSRYRLCASALGCLVFSLDA